MSFFHIASDIVEELDIESAHKYIGKLLTVRLRALPMRSQASSPMSMGVVSQA